MKNQSNLKNKKINDYMVENSNNIQEYPLPITPLPLSRTQPTSSGKFNLTPEKKSKKNLTAVSAAVLAGMKQQTIIRGSPKKEDDVSKSKSSDNDRVQNRIFENKLDKNKST